jgi:putative nucleotidyltransferase with HDIG domain
MARLRSFRLTFLWRFTLLTLAVSVLAALVLAAAVENAHRKAIETDIEAAALARASAELARPLDGLGAGTHLSDVAQHAFTNAANDASLSEFVTGLRVYRASGQAVYPASAPAAPAEVHAALATDNFVRVESGPTVTAFAPVFTRGEHVYVLAVDFSTGQLAVRFATEARQVAVIVLGAVSVIFLSLVTLAAGASRELERRRREARHTFVHTLEVMADTIDLRDPYTAGHSKRVAVYSRALAAAAGLANDSVDTIESGALLHDIGKIAIPDRVLFKPAKLDPDERRIIESHPTMGAKLLANVPGMDEVTRCVLHHHERLDGNGYPARLIGEAIPFGARVIAVADTFDAMTTDRPYRRALSVEAAVVELRRVAGAQLDARLVEIFVRAIERGDVVLLQRPVAPDAAQPAFGRKAELSATA